MSRKTRLEQIIRDIQIHINQYPVDKDVILETLEPGRKKGKKVVETAKLDKPEKLEER